MSYTPDPPVNITDNHLAEMLQRLNQTGHPEFKYTAEAAIRQGIGQEEVATRLALDLVNRGFTWAEAYVPVGEPTENVNESDSYQSTQENSEVNEDTAPSEDEAVPTPDFTEMSRDEVLAWAFEHLELTLPGNSSKADAITAIEQALDED